MTPDRAVLTLHTVVRSVCHFTVKVMSDYEVYQYIFLYRTCDRFGIPQIDLTDRPSTTSRTCKGFLSRYSISLEISYNNYTGTSSNSSNVNTEVSGGNT